MTLQEFLQYIQSSAGINAVIGVILSFVADAWPGYAALDAKVKRGLMMLLCFALPVFATIVLGCYTADCIWAALLAGGSAFFGSQVAHTRDL